MRRAALLATCPGIIALANGLLASGDWPLFRGNPHQTGVSSSRLPQKIALLWTYEARQPIRSSPVISGDTVYIGTDSGFLLALNLADGRVKWKYDTGARRPVRAAPAAGQEKVYVGDDTGVFHAVNSLTGRRVWTFRTGQQIVSAANASGTALVFGSYDRFVYCLSPAGKLLWKAETEAQVHATPCVFPGGVAVAGCDGVLRVLCLATGAQTAAIDVPGNVAASPVFADGKLFVVTFTGKIACVDAGSMNTVWETSVSQDESVPVASSPAVAGGRIVFGCRDGSLRCFDTADGKPVWKFSTRGDVDSSPVICGERVFVGSADGTVYEVDLSTGRRRWSFTAGAAVFSSAAVAQERLVIAAEDGAVYCFGDVSLRKKSQ